MITAQRQILVVEDDDAIREALTEALISDGHAITSAANGMEALQLFASSSIDLVLLDLMLPGVSGYDVCRQIRDIDKGVPIIMLTAKAEEIDKVLGLELGADDYVTKPFGVRELLARVHTAFRRLDHAGPIPKASDTPTEDSFLFGTATIDRRHYTATLDGTALSLSARELQLLEYLFARPNEVLTRDQLLNAVWGINYFGTTRTLDQHIAQLRKKVAGTSGLRLIRTVHGVGYKFVP